MKKSTFFKSASLALACAAATAAFSGCGSKNYAENNTAFFIGASGPLTGSAASYGVAVQRGAELAVEEINAKNEDGMRFTFEIKDDKASAADVPTNFAALYEKGMQLSLGAVTSGACLSFKGLAAEKNLFTLCPSATADDVTKDADTVFQMCFSDSNQGTVAAQQYFNTDAVPAGTKLGILYCSNDAYSKGIYDTFKAALDTSKFAEVSETSFRNDASGNPPTDMNSQVETLKNCSYFFMPVYYTPAVTFMLAAKGKIASDAVYFGCDGFDGIDTSVKDFDIHTVTQRVSMLSHFFSGSPDEKVQSFVTAYKNKYGSTPIQFAASAYDSVYAMYEAVKTARAEGKEISYTTAADELGRTLSEIFRSETFTFSGVTTAGGTATWSAGGTVNKRAEIVVIKEADA